MSLADRKPIAKQLKVTPLLTHRGQLKQAEVVSGKNHYHVGIVAEGRQYRVACHCKTDPARLPDCPGNSYRTVCKHSLAAMVERATMAGVKLSIVEDVKDGNKITQAEQRQHAERLSRLGGCVIVIKSNQGNGQVWAVARRG